MSIVRKMKTTHVAHRTARGYRDLARAIDRAPTRASRDELLNLTNMGR
jgi:hypothetical protein